MLGYALRRLLLALPLLLGITFVSFTVIHLAPGDSAEIQTGDLSIQSDAQARQLLREMYDLDKPLHVQYGKWLARLGRLDFGKSFSPDGRPVLQKIGERLPVTLLLNIIEMLIIVALAVPIGVLSATRQYSLFDKVTTVFVFVGFATPDFWLALLLMILFGVQLGWLPISGLRSLNWEYLSSGASSGTSSATSSCRSWSRRSAGSPASRATCASPCSRSSARTTSSRRGPRAWPRPS